MLLGNGIFFFFAFFVDLLWGKCGMAVPFLTTTTNTECEIISYLAQVYVFHIIFLGLLIERIGGRKKIDS